MANFICGDNANEIWSEALDKIKKHGKKSNDTTELLHTMFELKDPRQRWVSCRHPAMSISFALAEVIWILVGDNSRTIVDFWNPSYKQYAADEGSDSYHGAYGYRLRKNFGFDQLKRAYESLKFNPGNRQTVLLYWDAEQDFPNSDGSRRSKDIPCNVCSILKVRNGKLEWTQIMRSNDIFLGLPYNLIQFTTIQEILAGWLNLEVGSYTHFSDSLHLYDRDYDKCSKERCDIKNSDSLAISKELSEKLINEIYRRMLKVTQGNIGESELLDIFTLNSGIKTFDNILAVIGMYVANKWLYYDAMKRLFDLCDNDLFKEICTRYYKT